MALLEFDWTPDPEKLRTFGLAWALLGLGAGLFLGGTGRLPGGWAAGIALLGLLGGGAALFRPSLLRPLYVLLQVPAWPIGLVLGNLVLAFMFYLVLTPVGLLRRALGKDPLDLRRKESRETYWTERAGPPPRERYFRQF